MARRLCVRRDPLSAGSPSPSAGRRTHGPRRIPASRPIIRPSRSRLAASARILSRIVFAEVPPRVEYEITPKARDLGPTMEALTVWWSEYGSSLPARPTSRGRKARPK
ncbi:winged helix-turn-helix transcriptional regulator [Lysobacter sp. Root559]|uniref:winged helix-turn-helix transcriptional regulator n=1 Tax=Lysobacter sp. Root559 TaxID=1736559 RepID=UPI0012FC1213|nr:winged helix-turn-helix transcriptional regulator [Lysobacter sp. Root559]